MKVSRSKDFSNGVRFLSIFFFLRLRQCEQEAPPPPPVIEERGAEVGEGVNI